MLTRKTPVLLVAALIGLAIATTAGCGGGDDEPGPIDPEPESITAPEDLTRALYLRAARGKIDAMLDLLSDDARNQTGKAWIAFVRRAEAEQAYAELSALSDETKKIIEVSKSDVFFTRVHEEAPTALGKIFQQVYYVTHVEKDGRLLVRLATQLGHPVHVGMLRGDDGSLRLTGEEVSREIYQAMRGDLADQLRKEASGG